MNRKRVLVAMSGGVDSSVALLRLLQDGYEAIGATMKLWEYGDVGGNLLHDSNCCSIEAINNAKLVCQMLGVPHYTLDFQETFRRKVVDNFVDEYLSGRTPNPCVRCNIYLKWDTLIKRADQLDVYWIATGHYAIVDRSDPDHPILRKGADAAKDQTYVLWGINGEAVKRTLLPLGPLTKRKVRSIAQEAGLVTADVPESQEICFVADNDYRRFLQEFAAEKMEKERRGEFRSVTGSKLGEHCGISHYTVGQRRGLGAYGPQPAYVQRIDAKSGTITLAPRDKMFFDGCTVEQPNWLQDPRDHSNGDRLHVQIRYHHPGVSCRLDWNGDGTVAIQFDKPQFAVTPGQSAVLHWGDQLLGGGIISRAHLHD